MGFESMNTDIFWLSLIPLCAVLLGSVLLAHTPVPLSSKESGTYSWWMTLMIFSPSQAQK
ncbi:hypothetical protein TIFTF001_021317 [Ficus carica]|uniref:Uncharacterized protein n=1 Tax=Ficus carica TaxID=3494 RepID=A0AA88DDJ1_FICCA|nr:hypothetical protein TIFTF001_021317 [Ficus carica]